MKTSLALLLLATAVPAFAQSNPAAPPASAPAGMQSDPAAALPPASTPDASMPAAAPAPAAAAPAQQDAGSYPDCSRTVVDKCIQRGAAHRGGKKHR